MSRLRRLARPLPALLVVTAAALLARLWALGWRVAHQDEARVADWILHYMEVGAWEYRPIIHGPFLPHVNSAVFAVLPPTDFTMRLVVALVGGLLPLSAWLFRERLRGSEVVALGLLLAANPLLLYYSRFMRNDVLVGAFMLTALGLFVRAYDTRRTRYLYAGTAVFALAFTAKELALLYPFYWLGAGVLLLDHRLSVAAVREEGLIAATPPWFQRAWARLVRDPLDWALSLPGAVRESGPRAAVPGWLSRVRDRLVGAGRRALAWVRSLPDAEVGPHLRRGAAGAWGAVRASWLAVPRPVRVFGVAGVEFVAVIVFFYAPRATGPEGLGLFNALRDPRMLPALVHEATYGTWMEFLDTWGRTASGHSYVEYLEVFWEVLRAGAEPLLALAVVGFLVDRYAGDGPRDVVAVASYWGFASVVTYPIIADNPFPWEMVHVVVPLAVPAAVGLALVYRHGARGLVDDDAVSVGAAAVLLVLLLGQMGATAYDTSFERPQDPDNTLVQYAQPAGHMQETLAEIDALSRTNDGVDVLFYGDMFDRPDGAEWIGLRGAPRGWFDRLPLPWYLHRYGSAVDSTTDEDEVLSDPPPVVIALGEGAFGDPTHTAEDIAELEDRGYRRVVHQQYLWGRPLVFYVRTSQ